MLLSLVLVVPTLVVPTLAAANKVTNNYLEGAELKQDFNNAQFHCNAVSGNGRVWPVIPADMKKFDGQLTFTKADGTRWNLTGVAAQNLDAKGKAIKDSYTALEMVVCPKCGSTEWITFSNNSGLPDGKNVQMQHPAPSLTLPPPVFPGSATFYKTKYGGLLPVANGEFAFDLFKVNADGSIGAKVGTYTNDADGKIDFPIPAPGEYVFIEQTTVDYDRVAMGGGEAFGYKYVWNAAPLYVEIAANGDIIWADGNVMNNEYACKHTLQWTPGDMNDPNFLWLLEQSHAEYFEVNGIPGALLRFGFCGNNFTIDEVRSYPATCTSWGVTYVGCDNPLCQTGFGFGVEAPRGHNYIWDYDEPGAYPGRYFCTICGPLDYYPAGTRD